MVFDFIIKGYYLCDVLPLDLELHFYTCCWCQIPHFEHYQLHLYNGFFCFVALNPHINKKFKSLICMMYFPLILNCTSILVCVSKTPPPPICRLLIAL